MRAALTVAAALGLVAYFIALGVFAAQQTIAVLSRLLGG